MESSKLVYGVYCADKHGNTLNKQYLVDKDTVGVAGMTSKLLLAAGKHSSRWQENRKSWPLPGLV